MASKGFYMRVSNSGSEKGVDAPSVLPVFDLKLGQEESKKKHILNEKKTIKHKA